MEMSNSCRVEKFDGKNFKQWKFQIKCALRAKGLDINTPKPKEKAAQVQWNKEDGMAMFILTASMDFNQIAIIENCDTAKEVMNKLEAIYEQKSEFNKMMIHEKFYQYAYSSSDTMAQHVSKVEGLAKDLRECGEELSETAVITKILSTLPPLYGSLRQAWLSLDVDKQTIQNLTSRLIDEEARLMNDVRYDNRDDNALIMSKRHVRFENNKHYGKKTLNNSGHRFVCYNCNKRGHFARECKAPKKSGYKNQEQSSMLAFSEDKESLLAFNAEKEASSSGEDKWILDSGASVHMTYRREFFCEYNNYDENSSVKLGNKEQVKVCGKGSVLIRRKVNNQWEYGILEDVLYVPELRRNLFSEGVAARRGYVILKKNERASIIKNNVTVMSANLKENNLYELEIRTVIQENCNIMQSDVKIGHVQELQEMSKAVTRPKECVEIKIDENNLEKPCVLLAEESVQDEDESKQRKENKTIKSGSRGMNLRRRANRKMELNLTTVDIPESYEEEMNIVDRNHWKKAIEREVKCHEDGHDENDTSTITDRTEKKYFSSKWVFLFISLLLLTTFTLSGSIECIK